MHISDLSIVINIYSILFSSSLEATVMYTQLQLALHGYSYIVKNKNEHNTEVIDVLAM